MIKHFVPDVGDDAIDAVGAALRLGRLSSGAEVARLEAAVSEAYDGAHVVAVSSGTAALYLALKALGVGVGDRVAIPSYTCNSLYAAVAHAGAEARCVDCGPDLPVPTAETIAPVLDGTIRAVVLPHTGGFPADVAAVRGQGRPVIEDCAHAIGGRLPDGRRLGTLGDIAVLSFYASKLLPAGEGGACMTRDAGQADLIRRLRQADEQDLHPWAFNFKMSDLCAAVAQVQWRRLSGQIERREAMARDYDEILGAWSLRRRFAVRQSVCFRYLVDVGDAEAFLAAALAAGVECKRPIYRPLHLSLGGACPIAEEWHRRVVSIPCYPGLSEPERRTVCHTVRDLLRRRSGADQ